VTGGKCTFIARMTVLAHTLARQAAQLKSLIGQDYLTPRGNRSYSLQMGTIAKNEWRVALQVEKGPER
jgi:hypothetical protein